MLITGTSCQTEWIDCHKCGGSGEDDGCTCGEDTCCCLEPTPPDCHVCAGEGGWLKIVQPENGA